MMKNVTMGAVALCVCAACTVSENYSVKGTVQGAGDEAQVELTGLNAAGEDSLLTSCKLLNGAFEAEVAKTNDMIYLDLTESKKRVPVFFEADVNSYVLNADAEGNPTVKGGKLQDLWNAYSTQNAYFQSQKDSVEAIYRQAAKDDDLFAKMHERAIYEDLVKAQESFEDSLLKQNDNIVSAAIVWRRAKELVGKRMLADKVKLLGKSALQTTPGKAVKLLADNIDRMEKENVAPDFTQNDPEGNPVSLYGIKAKVKVLDFWASWCGPCRAETPNVRRVYEKYKDAGLEIISVSLDTKKENWLQAIEKDQMNWIHTSDLKGWNNAVAKRYGISSVPSILLLDENNRIIARNLRGEALEEAIKNALGK